jgi:hypothetical protein
MALEVSIDIADTRHKCTGQKFYPVYIKARVYLKEIS